MSMTEAEELELLSLERERAQLGSMDVPDQESSFLQTVENVANDINRGIVGSVPGLTHFANKVGIGIDRVPEGESKPIGTAALEMTGMAAASVPMLLGSALKNAAAPVSEQLIAQANAARTGPLSGVKESVKSFLDNTAKSSINSPFKFFGAETAAAASSGAAGQITYNQTESQEAKAVAELVGGTLPTLVPSVVSKLPDITLTGLAYQKVRQLFSPDKMKFGKERAANRLLDATEDPLEVIQRGQSADVLKDAPLTAIEKSGDEGLLGLEASIRNETDNMVREERLRFGDINRVIRGELEDLPGDQGSSFEDTREYLTNLLDERVRVAGANVEARLNSLEPSNGKESASHLAREELDKAYDAAVTQESQMWSAVDNGIEANLESTQSAYKELWETMADNRVSFESFNENLPASVKKYIGKFNKKGELKKGKLKDGITTGEIKELRSELLHEARVERGQKPPNRRKLKTLATINEALLEDLSSVQGDEALDIARAFSADLNSRFRQGDVGQILGFTTFDETSAGLTLQKVLSKSKIQGAEGVDNLLQASPEMSPYIKDYLLDEFLTASKRQGDFNVGAASNYLKTKKDVLSRFPEAEKAMQQAIESQDRFIAQRQIANLNGKSSAAILLKQPLGRELSSLKRSTNIPKASAEIKDLLKGDSRAEEGFRRAVVEDIIDRSSSNTLDSSGEKYIEGNLLKSAVEDPSTLKILNEFLSKEQISRLQKIQNTASLAQKSRTSQADRGDIIGDDEGMIISSLRDIMGAASGRAFGRAVGSGGTVQIPAIFVRTFRGLHQASLDPAKILLSDAVLSENPDLLKAILSPDAFSSPQYSSKLNAWAAATAAKYALEEDE